MVVALGPGKFYGSSLPRPRIYTDVKLNSERVDPPASVTDPLMTWANDAHWSMGGVSLTRHRLQGRIEGNCDRLRAQLDDQICKKLEEENQKKTKSKKGKSVKGKSVKGKNGKVSEISETPSPPPAPVAIKRRRVVGLVDEDEIEEEIVVTKKKRGLVRKLGDDFERVARESGMVGVEKEIGENVGAEKEIGENVGATTRSKRGVDVNLGEIKKVKKQLVTGGGRRIGASMVAAASRVRTSPRLMKKSGLGF